VRVDPYLGHSVLATRVVIPPGLATAPTAVAGATLIVEDVGHELVQIVATICGRIDDAQVVPVMSNLMTARSAGDTRSRADIDEQIITVKSHDHVLDAIGSVSFGPMRGISTTFALPSVVAPQVRIDCWELAPLDEVDLSREALPAGNRCPRVRERPEGGDPQVLTTCPLHVELELPHRSHRILAIRRRPDEATDPVIGAAHVYQDGSPIISTSEACVTADPVGGRARIR